MNIMDSINLNLDIELFVCDTYGNNLLMYLNYFSEGKIPDKYYDFAIDKIQYLINTKDLSYCKDVAFCFLKTGIIRGKQLELFETMVTYVIMCPDIDLNYPRGIEKYDNKSIKVVGLSLLFLSAMKNSVTSVKKLLENTNVNVNKNHIVEQLIKCINEKNLPYDIEIIKCIISHPNYKLNKKSELYCYLI